MTRQFVYSVHDLQNDGREFDSPLPPSWITAVLEGCDLGPFEDEPGHLQVRLSMSGRDVVVRGRLKVPFGVPCARCLKPVRVMVDSELGLLLMPGRPSRPAGAAIPRAKRGQPAAAADKTPIPRPPKHASNTGFSKGRWAKEGDKEVYEFSQEEAEIDTYDGDEVVLDDFLREMILLEAPIFPLCSEECPGIRAIPEHAPHLDVEPTKVDPRLQPLLKLKKSV
ncbi:MAG: DUF177 domain-containing protein [Deltaproteobacteria bacterium]|nr:DUF177 domain-containing protein [Deltaproteobacteria bacterium]